MVSNLKTFTNKGCKIAAQFVFFLFWEVIQQGPGGYTTRIRRLYNKDLEVINKDQEVISRIFFGIGATIRIGQKRCFLSRMLDFFGYKRVECPLVQSKYFLLHSLFGTLVRLGEVRMGKSAIKGATISTFKKVKNLN